MDKKYFQLSQDELKAKYQTDLEKGLTNDEAIKRLEVDGFNALEEAKKRPLILRFFDQLKDFMIIILLIAAVISMINSDVAEGILIVAIVLINALLGVFQEAKAEKALDSIKAMSSPHVTVIRDGIEIVIDVKDIVKGDLVNLVAGDYIPADVRIIESINLKIDESALTGEAVPVEKEVVVLENNDVALGDRINSAYMSTVVTYGRGKAVVIATAMETEIGKIAMLLQETEQESTPLQKNISQLGKTLAIIALVITGLIFLIEIVQGLLTSGSADFAGALLFAVSLAVAAIPEGLPAIITVVLSIGMQNLVKQRAIMRTLPAVETLGSTSIICSDKTGTLTQNVMTVQKVYLNKELIDIRNIQTISADLKRLSLYGVLVNDTKVQLTNQNYVKIGDPTEVAFIDLAINLKQDPIQLAKTYQRLHELPFDSERKLMTTVHEIDGELYAIIKGAPDVLFGLSKEIDLGSSIEPATKHLDAFVTANDQMSNEALRVLAVAYKKISKNTPLKSLSFADLETDVTLLGLVGMIDPERPEVKDAIQLCKRAGIKTIMITGDHKNTAVAIANNLQILTDDDLAITGKELDLMSDDEFESKLEHIKVYARVSPENKVRIVKAWRKTNLVVAMTGDGVNDAPSIKQADIGIAMGITGTEVAKGAADMVLTDDNFATIVNAVGEGRGIFANIKKAIHFLLSCNIGEIVAMFLGVTIGAFLFKVLDENTGQFVDGTVHILIAVQILWVNLVTDSLMAIALGLEPKEPDIMDYAPRDATKSIFADGLGKLIGLQGAMIGLITFAAYYIGYHLIASTSPEGQILNAQTMAFMVLALSQLVHAFNTRSRIFSVFTLKQNKYLFYALFASLLLQIGAVAFPFTQKLFHVTMPNVTQWLIIIGLSLIPLLVVEIHKIFIRKKLK